MPAAIHPIDAIPPLLSLDVTAGLVKAGHRAAWRNGVAQGDPRVLTLDVLGASNTSPIVITVPANSLTVSDDAIGVRTGRHYHVVVADVGGLTAANKLDAKPQRNEAWVAVATSPTTLALYDIDASTGLLVASVGSGQSDGVYTSGGTVSKAFADGLIRVGREFVAEQTSPPQVVFVPAFVEDLPGNMTGAFSAAAFASGEPERQRLLGTFRGQRLWYEVHIWAGGGVGFGPALLIKEQIQRSCQARAAGCWQIGRANWEDQHPSAPQRTKLDHWLSFTLGIDVPIPRDAVEFAPDPTTAGLTMALQLQTETPEEA
jgi:hypothetical protein